MPIFRKYKQRVAAYQEVFGTATGKQVLKDLFDRFHRQTAVGHSEMQTFMLVGQQVLIREILDLLAIHPLQLEEEFYGPDPGDWEPHGQ